jgi:hypothetical protein
MLSQSGPLVSGYALVLISRQLEQLAGPKTRCSVGSENPGRFRGTSSMSAKCQRRTLVAPGTRIVIRQFRENKLHSFYSHSN